MSVNTPVIVESSNLSNVWAAAFIRVYDQTPALQAPMVVSISNFSGPIPIEDSAIRSAVDDSLLKLGCNSTSVSGMTIFPYDIWCRRGRPPCDKFTAFCMTRLLPRLQARDRRNQYGTYFQRMMSYSGSQKNQLHTCHQLSYVINFLKNSANRRMRESALQLACFDPSKDHTGQPVRGFPCLQQVGISHDSDGRFGINAFYPSQYIFDRAYGNYLGLCHLGAFIAHETGLKFSRLNCFIGDPRRSDSKISKEKLKGLADFIRKRPTVVLS